MGMSPLALAILICTIALPISYCQRTSILNAVHKKAIRAGQWQIKLQWTAYIFYSHGCCAKRFRQKIILA